MIYYCCTSSPSFTMHIVNMEITIADDHIQWLGRLNKHLVQSYDKNTLTVREDRLATTHCSRTESYISARLLVNWVAVVICCHISSLDVKM